jgi:hypothetical protein
MMRIARNQTVRRLLGLTSEAREEIDIVRQFFFQDLEGAPSAGPAHELPGYGKRAFALQLRVRINHNSPAQNKHSKFVDRICGGDAYLEEPSAHPDILHSGAIEHSLVVAGHER